jgi:hypothetical protein
MPFYCVGHQKCLHHTSPTQVTIFSRKENEMYENSAIRHEYNLFKLLVERPAV